MPDNVIIGLLAIPVIILITYCVYIYLEKREKVNRQVEANKEEINRLLSVDELNEFKN